jgi:hypothetical protein
VCGEWAGGGGSACAVAACSLPRPFRSFTTRLPLSCTARAGSSNSLLITLQRGPAAQEQISRPALARPPSSRSVAACLRPRSRALPSSNRPRPVRWPSPPFCARNASSSLLVTNLNLVLRLRKHYGKVRRRSGHAGSGMLTVIVPRYAKIEKVGEYPCRHSAWANDRVRHATQARVCAAKSLNCR